MRTVSALMVILLSAMAVPAASQTPSVGQKPRPAARSYTPPKTPDGQADIQGAWTNATITPFERPNGQTDKAFLTEEEAATLEKRTLERRAQAASTPGGGEVGRATDLGTGSGSRL